MKAFSELGVKSKNLTGDKIEIVDIIDKEITVLDYRVKDSKYSRDGMCLTLQIQYNGETRVIFSGSGVLLEDIEKLPKEAFPFTTTIKKIAFKERQFFLKFT
jgi:hypothetical protein